MQKKRKKLSRPSSLPSLIKPRNYLVPIAHFKKGGAHLDKKKMKSRDTCRIFKHEKEIENA